MIESKMTQRCKDDNNWNTDNQEAPGIRFNSSVSHHLSPVEAYSSILISQILLNELQILPKTVLIAIRTTDVGVETFSLILKSHLL